MSGSSQHQEYYAAATSYANDDVVTTEGGRLWMVLVPILAVTVALSVLSGFRHAAKYRRADCGIEGASVSAENKGLAVSQEMNREGTAGPEHATSLSVNRERIGVKEHPELHSSSYYDDL